MGNNNRNEVPDLAAQLESLLHTVWECEKDWALDDRIDLSLRSERVSGRHEGRRSRSA